VKILHVHTAYRQSGGEDRVVASERELLGTGGHEVMPFDARNSPRALPAAAQLMLAPWNPVSTSNLVTAARSFAPDLAHIHNTWFALSPGAPRSLRRAGVPVVMTLHNYRLICINANLLREGSPCDLCITGSRWSGVRHRCYHDGVAGSVIATATAMTWATRSTLDSVAAFIALTDFSRNMFVRGGLDPDRIRVLPNFTFDPGQRPTPPSVSDTVLFVGRLSTEKGVETLIQAWESEPRSLRLVVAGDGPLLDRLAARHPGVSFIGRLSASETSRMMLTARAVVYPSLSYENQSMVLLEAMAAGLPVLASDWPTVRETLVGTPAGMLVPPGDREAWANALGQLENDDTVDLAGLAARRRYEAVHTPELGLQRLEALYRKVAGFDFA